MIAIVTAVISVRNIPSKHLAWFLLVLAWIAPIHVVIDGFDSCKRQSVADELEHQIHSGARGGAHEDARHCSIQHGETPASSVPASLAVDALVPPHPVSISIPHRTVPATPRLARRALSFASLSPYHTGVGRRD